MGGPYRATGPERPPEPSADQGIVGEVIAQFADPFAFLRELVQNAIDAGTPHIDIRIAWDAGRMRVSVRDRGGGMTREVIEHQLLVLFRSTKEQDRTKIGKFGIGFTSVLAPNPTVVVVETVSSEPAAGERRRLALHLFRDLTYRLFDAGPATQVGTLVELELPMEASAVDAFLQQSLAALERWCRHATVPIHAETVGVDGSTVRTRIDRPLGLPDAVVEVRADLDDGQLSILLGLPGESGPSLAFFNHGLLLWETTEPLVGPYACTIQDSRLGHTLSRDNVRRDDAFRHAVTSAQALVPRLHRAIEVELRTRAGAPDLTAYQTLSSAIIESEIEIPRDRWFVPLVDPVEVAGERVSAVPLTDTHPDWYALRPSPLTACLARHGVKLVRWGYAPAPLREEDVHEQVLLVTPVADPTPYQLALASTLLTCFEAVGRTPREVTLARVGTSETGAVLAIAGEPADAVHAAPAPHEPYVLAMARARRSPFARLRRAALVVNVDHPLVQEGPDPRIVAAQVARMILLEHRLLDVGGSERLLGHALQLLGAP